MKVSENGETGRKKIERENPGGSALSSSFSSAVKDDLLGVILHTFTHKHTLSTAGNWCHEN